MLRKDKTVQPTFMSHGSIDPRTIYNIFVVITNFQASEDGSSSLLVSFIQRAKHIRR